MTASIRASQRTRTPWRLWSLVALAGLTAGDAQGNSLRGRQDFVVTFSRGKATVAINGGALGATTVSIKRGTMSLTSHDGWCVPTSTPPHPCRYTINSIEFQLNDFEIADTKIEGLQISNWEPIAGLVSVFDVQPIPDGTPFNAGARIDGQQTALSIRANALLTIQPEQDSLGVLGSFKTRFENREIDVAVFGLEADAPFANHPPRANAGPDQTHEAECVAEVRLDPSATRDQDGNFSHAFFSEHGVPIGSHVQPVPFLPGRHVLTLDARDARGARDTSEVLIDVKATETVLPVSGAASFSVEVPNGLRPEDVALLSLSDFSVGPKSRVIPADSSGAIVNLGTGTTTLGVDTRVKDVWSRGPVVIHTDGVVDGAVHTRSTVDRKNRAVVHGVVETDAVFDPVRKTAWNAVLGPTSLGDVTIGAKRTGGLGPGRYGHVLVQPGASLTMEPGVYVANELTIKPGARIDVHPAGPLFLYVLGAIEYKGPIVVPNPSDFLLAYSGSEPVALMEPFSGTLLAPKARVVLAKVDGVHSGAWFAGAVEVRPDVVIEHHPFDWSGFGEARSACVITPVVKCVTRGGAGSVARFGYKNVLTYSGVSVPLGAFNRMTPGPEQQGQPSSFRPGAHDVAFEVPFKGSPVTWVVGARSATATSESPSCP